MLVRLAKIEDYVPSEHFAGMYQVKWCEVLCPGNPAKSPEEGVELFNTWQQQLAHGEGKSTPMTAKLTAIVTWCLANRDRDFAKTLAAWIVQTYKRPNASPQLRFDDAALDAETRGFALDIQFAREEIPELPGSVILSLQNMTQKEG